MKHRLRDWIESRLYELNWNRTQWKPDPSALQEQLNQDLGKAGLVCGDEWKIPCGEWSELGFLGDVSLEMRAGSLLVVKTAIGIGCGYDESAYAYKRDDRGWQRFWQSEQDDYRADKYFPQTFDEVAISPTSYDKDADKSAHLILTLGHNPWCSSNWQTVYYRVWQTRSGLADPILLLDGSEIGFIDGSIRGTASRHDVLFEYSVDSIEGGFTRPEIRHYLFNGDRLDRVDPVATTPGQFVAFWLAGSPDASSRSEPGNRAALQQWRRVHSGPFQEFGLPPRHCKQQPDLWQLSTTYGEHEEQPVYFVVRWRPPYRFTMLSAGSQPRPDCTEEDPAADQPLPLFPGR